MERKIPSSIDYSDILPLSVPATAKRRRFFPQNGTTFNAAGSNEIRIDISSVNSLLDHKHSYLEFEVVNNLAATLGFDIGGGAIFFESLRIEQGGKILSRCDEYNRLNSGILAHTQDSFDGSITESIHGGSRAFNAGAGILTMNPAPVAQDIKSYSTINHNTNTRVAAGARYRFTLPLITGLFSQDKYIPLPLVDNNNPIVIVLNLCPIVNVGVFTGAADPAANGLSIERISYVAQLIEVGRDVIDQMKMMRDMMGGQLVLSGTDYEYNSGSIPGGAAGAGTHMVPIPNRKRSIKSIFFNMTSPSLANAAAGESLRNFYNLSFAGCANLDSYQIVIGATTYPPTAINAFGSVGNIHAALSRGEAASELAKALGSLSLKNPTGKLNTCTYAVSPVGGGLATGDNGAAGALIAPESNEVIATCPFGLDLEAWQNELLESGVDNKTFAEDINLQLNIDAIGPGLEAKIVNCWVLFDQHYYFNSDGSITYSN